MREKVDKKEKGVAKREHYFVMAHTHEFYPQEKRKDPKNTTVKDCSAKEAMIRSVCSAVSSISHIVLDEMLHWFKYAFDGFYKCPNDVKNNIFNNCYDDNGNHLPHPGVTILPEIVGELYPPVILDTRNYLHEDKRYDIYKRLKQDVETLCKSIGKSEEDRIGNLNEIDVHLETKEVLSFIQRKAQSFVFHMDNAPCHNSRATREYLEENKVVRIDHPPYSPDLAPSDFYLFGYVKNAFANIVLNSMEEAVKEIMAFVEGIPKKQLIAVFDEWRRRLKNCIEREGEYTFSPSNNGCAKMIIPLAKGIIPLATLQE